MFWRFTTFLAVFVFAAAALAGGKVRTWTSTDGRTMQAEFVRELDGDVTFLKDGKLIVIKLEKLSEKDQQAVKDLAAGKESEEDPFTTPKPNPAASSNQEKPAEPLAEKPTGKPGEISGEKPEKKKPITLQSRTWTDRFGNKSTGKFVRVDGNDVVITRAARVVTVAFGNLSDADQEYVRNVLISQGKEDAIPSATMPAGGAGGNFSGGNTGFPPAGGGISGPGMGGGISGPGMMPRGGMAGGAMGGAGRGPGAGMGGMPPGINPPPSTAGSAVGANPGPSALGPMGMGMGPAGTGFPGGGAGMGSAGGMPTSGMGAGMMPGTMGTGGMGGPGGMSPPGGMMGPGMMGQGMGPGMGAGMGPGMGTRMPGMEPTSIPQSPSFPGVQIEEYFECSKCKAKLTKLEASGSTCPRCNTTWGFKQDEFGNKTMTSAGRSQMSSVGAVIVIFVLLGLVIFIALFVGIIVAVVKAASAPVRPQQPMQQPMQRYY